MTDLQPGDICFINGRGDLFMDGEVRPFINQRCVFIKKTKAGLFLVALEADQKQRYSAPQKNISREQQ